jgi:hypothetical protein
MGYCAVVSFEAIKAKMIEKGDISKDQIDSKFFVIIILKVSTYMKHTINEEFSTMVLLLIVRISLLGARNESCRQIYCIFCSRK